MIFYLSFIFKVEFNIENESNIEFIRSVWPEFNYENITFVQNFFFQMQSSLNGRTFPNFYSVDPIVISRNFLQPDRYFEAKFRYCNTVYRQSIFEKINQIISSNDQSKIKLTGLQGSGKSFFLSDYVLRKRILGKTAKTRIFYINNSDKFIQDSWSYFFKELVYMLIFDLEMDQKDFKEISLEIDFGKPIENPQDIFQWLLFLNENQSEEKKGFFFDFLQKLKKYFNNLNIKLILIWDQIKSFFRDEHKNNSNIYTFGNLTQSFTYFDHIMLSASNINQELQNLDESFLKIDIMPFKVFTKIELRNLVKTEFSSYSHYRPNDKKKEEFEKYSLDLCEFLHYSISEYFIYKKTSWDIENKILQINAKSFSDLRANYLEKRAEAMRESENHFRKEYIKSKDKLFHYNEALAKILTYDEISNLSQEKKVTSF